MKVQFQVSKDRHTLWVNSVTGMNIARFSSKGIDIHHDIEGQKKHGKQCLFCTHGSDPFNPVPFVQDWELFKQKLHEHHGIRVPARIRMNLRDANPRNTNVNKVAIKRLHAPVQEITINLEQWEDRRIEHGIEKGLSITLKEHSEPECFELRSDGGHQVLNKGELAALGRAFLELADYEVGLLPDKSEKDRLGMVERPPPPLKRRATLRRVRP